MTDLPTIHALRATLGLSTGGLARLVGVERRTAERWVSGAIPVPEPVYRLLRLVLAIPDGVVLLRWLVGHPDTLPTHSDQMRVNERQ